MKISVSKLRAFRECKAKYDYRYNEKLTKDKALSNSVVFGSAYHKALEVWYDPQTWNPNSESKKNQSIEAFKNYLEQNISDDYRWDIYGNNELPALIDLGVGMLSWYFNSNDFSGITPIAVEFKFELQIFHDVTIIGAIDLIYEEDGVIKARDHKTANKRFAINEDVLWLDEQAEIYTMVARAYGYNVSVFEYASHFKSFPKPPQLLKSKYQGRLVSIAAAETTFELALATIVENDPEGLANGLYFDYLQNLKYSETSYLAVETIRPTNETINVVLNRYKHLVDDINSTNEFYMTPSINCKYCQFLSICVEVATNGDPEIVKKLEYGVME